MSSNRSAQSSGLQVIGAGLMRTGTNSQMKALEILLGGRCYHMSVIMKDRRDHLKLWYEAATVGLTKELADRIFKDFRATTDYPAAHFYQELMQIYPNAKFVLSVRDPKRWVASVHETVQQASKAIQWMLPPVRRLFGVSHFLPAETAIFSSRLGLRYGMSDAEMIEAFERHNQAVIQTIPKERLLVFQVSDGWKPLCEFLELPVPDEPFPNVNDAAVFKKTVKILKVMAIVFNLGLCSVVGAVAWFGAKYCLNKFG